MSGNSWDFFFPESDTLILPTNTCTRSQMPGVVGDRDMYWTPGSLHAVQNHPSHCPQVGSRYKPATFVFSDSSTAILDSLGSHRLPPPTRQPQFSKEALRKETANY